jgi:hypothetical protein
MTCDRKKPGGVAFWATVVVVAGLGLYPLSFGPACWILTHIKLSPNTRNAIEAPYVPLFRILTSGPEWLRTPLDWYVSYWT